MVSRPLKDEMHKAFDCFNEDRTGVIKFRNLKAIAKELDENMTCEEIGEMVDMASSCLPYDKEGNEVDVKDKNILKDDFLKIMLATGLFEEKYQEDNKEKDAKKQ